MINVTIAAAFGPLAIHAGQAAISKWIGQNQCRTVADDEPMQQWVMSIIHMQRPFVIALTLSVWTWCVMNGMDSDAVNNATSAIVFYLFGDRTMSYARKMR